MRTKWYFIYNFLESLLAPVITGKIFIYVEEWKSYIMYIHIETLLIMSFLIPKKKSDTPMQERLKKEKDMDQIKTLTTTVRK